MMGDSVSRLFDLTGQVALVTGASQGIGLATARLLGAAGAKLVIVARREEPLHRAAIDLQSEGVEALAIAGDVSDPDQVGRAVEDAHQRLGSVDILVNNAGIAGAGLIDDLEVEDWNSVLNINLRGAFLCSKAVVPIMREQGRGVIVNMASISGQTGGMSASLHYAASKGGLIAFTRALAKQMAPWGRANAIAPGQIATEMGERNAEQVRIVKQVTPLRRLGDPVEVAACALFLASPASSYITGHVLNVNGGLL